jgi:phage protein U
MAITRSYQRYLTVPSAIISDGILPIPLWAVTSMTLSETYHLPPIGSSGAKAIVATHDDTITLSGVLVGAERFAWKFALETLAETAKRGGALEAFTGGAVSGLILITSMTIRTDMQIESLSFTATTAKRDALDVSITLAHMPRPSALGKLLDVASIGVAALADWRGN